MQKGILVKDGATVKEKRAYGGDISDGVMQAEVLRLQTLFPEYSVTLYESDQDADFLAATIR